LRKVDRTIFSRIWNYVYAKP